MQLMFVEQNKHMMPKDEAVVEHYNQMFNKAYKAPPPAASDYRREFRGGLTTAGRARAPPLDPL